MTAPDNPSSVERMVTGPRLWEPDTSGRRFYEVNSDLGFGIWFDIPNQKEIGFYKSTSFGPPTYQRGFTDYEGLPHLRIKGHRKRLPDISKYGRLRILSDRAKRLFEAVDPEAFEFRPMKATYGRKTEIPGVPYWLCDIVRMLDCVDEERSQYLESRGIGQYSWNYSYPGLYLARMKLDIVGNAHAFGLIRRASTNVFDNVLVDAIRAEKLTGVNFRDYQDVDAANKEFGRGDTQPLVRPVSGEPA